jgi:hypothetical protein
MLTVHIGFHQLFTYNLEAGGADVVYYGNPKSPAIASCK